MVKTILVKSTSVFLLFVMLCTAVSASSVTYRDVSPKHWAYDSIVSVTEAGLMHGKGKTAGTYFDKNGYVNAAEIYATLYRLAGKPEVKPTFTDEIHTTFFRWNPRLRWCIDSWKWAVFEGIAEVSYITDTEPCDTFRNLRYKQNKGVVRPPEDVYLLGHYWIEEIYVDKTATRTDVIMSLYYYLTAYMNIEISADVDLSVYFDWNDDAASTVTNDKIPYTKANYGSVLRPWSDFFISAWKWAVSSGIIEAYPNGTLDLGEVEVNGDEYIIAEPQFVTRAEYAVILDRFMQYLEEIK